MEDQKEEHKNGEQDIIEKTISDIDASHSRLVKEIVNRPWNDHGGILNDTYVIDFMKDYI
jgi:hypothetical protein